MPKILIVDDEGTSRLRLSKIVESLGYSVILASDGLKALSVLEDNPDIKCLVTDCQMPNLDGPGLITDLRSSGASLPIFVYSAYRSVKEIGALLNGGADAFLTYPVTRENISEYLHRYFSKMMEGNQAAHES